MFQTFDPVSDRSFAANHIPFLREELKQQNLDGFVIPHDDEYQNEYIPAYAERLMWVSGFSGSAGSAIVLQNKAILFVDGRYTLQARQQTDNTFFAYEDVTDNPPHLWLKENATQGMRIGYDPMLHSTENVKQLSKAAREAEFTLIAIDANPIDAAWDDQPPKPCALVKPHPLNLAGQSSDKKCAEVAETIAKAGADAALITAPPSIAWLFNIRGGDVARSPLPLGRAIIYASGQAHLFIAHDKLHVSLTDHLGDTIEISDEAKVINTLEMLGQKGKRVAVDPTLAPDKFVECLKQAGAAIIEMEDPCSIPRACKNSAELEGARSAHIRDGVAVTRFLHWLSGEVQTGAVDEITAAKKLEAFRSESGELADLSFDTISGAGPNGAIVHYRVTTETNQKLKLNSLFLIDSGGQYPDGTTDITRTVAIGTPTAEMRDRFTRVLKGHIALATARFPKGTTGHQLDSFARRPLWEAGLDYDHGTGHGVGSFLGVHEGPQRIAKWPNSQALLPGMIISNEPGFYKTGEFGIRIENLVIVTPPEPVHGGEREMLSFETITLAPIDLALVDTTLLTENEREWLNAYHARVRKTLTPLLSDDAGKWLAAATRAT